MKRAFVLLLCLLLPMGGVTAAAETSSGKLERVQFLGRDYVRLRDWALANSFKVRWLTNDKVVQLANPFFRLVFTANSREAEINGVKIWLSFPVAVRGGMGYIGLLDLQTAVQPVVFPARSASGAKIKTIMLDPGHGGRDPGNRTGSQPEKKYTLLLAQEVRAQLKSAGLTALLTRTTDAYVDLPVRIDLARRLGADLFVSLHFNGIGSSKSEVKGTEVYCLTPMGASSTNARGAGAGARSARGNRFDAKNMLLAYQMQESLAKTLGAEDRGVRRARFEVLREAAMPAVLIEGGFLSHPSEGRRIIDPAYRRRMAQAIVEGLLAYKRLVER
jgi:N-acetylmuramoyl-L-alanine amidase